MEIALGELEQFARGIAKELLPSGQQAIIVTLKGELGAGKTTFVKALARAYGIEHIVQSPTYVLMRSYPIKEGPFHTLVHIDAYRLDSAKEFEPLALNFEDPGVLVCIEWPERIQEAIPEPHRVITFAHTKEGGDKREILIK